MNNSNYSFYHLTLAFDKFGSKENTIGLGEYNESLIELSTNEPIFITKAGQEGDKVTFEFYQLFSDSEFGEESEEYVCTLDANDIRSIIGH